MLATDPLGHSHYYDYDCYGQMVSHIDPVAGVEYWQYDEYG
ncbi:MAG TPA: hypothetical protein ENN42_04705, partial [Thioalkalivibrio sp.]|nr:hypothetical protein [Thioalkalivibrio sp.]